MAKRVNSASFKGLLEIDWQTGKLEITEVTKESEDTYNIGDVLNEFNGKTVTFTIKEEEAIEPTGGLEQPDESEDFFHED